MVFREHCAALPKHPFPTLRGTEWSDYLNEFLNHNEYKMTLFRLLNKADMYTKIDVYNSAVFLRQAWDYMIEKLISMRQTAGLHYNDLLPNSSYYNIREFIGGTALLCNHQNLTNAREKLVSSTQHEGYNGYKQKITHYIKELGNAGAHSTETTLSPNDYLYRFFEPMDFGMVAIGMEFTAHILKNFFSHTDDYQYNVNNIPFRYASSVRGDFD